MRDIIKRIFLVYVFLPISITGTLLSVPSALITINDKFKLHEDITFISLDSFSTVNIAISTLALLFPISIICLFKYAHNEKVLLKNNKNLGKKIEEITSEAQTTKNDLIISQKKTLTISKDLNALINYSATLIECSRSITDKLNERNNKISNLEKELEQEILSKIPDKKSIEGQLEESRVRMLLSSWYSGKVMDILRDYLNHTTASIKHAFEKVLTDFLSEKQAIMIIVMLVDNHNDRMKPKEINLYCGIDLSNNSRDKITADAEVYKKILFDNDKGIAELISGHDYRLEINMSEDETGRKKYAFEEDFNFRLVVPIRQQEADHKSQDKNLYGFLSIYSTNPKKISSLQEHLSNNLISLARMGAYCLSVLCDNLDKQGERYDNLIERVIENVRKEQAVVKSSNTHSTKTSKGIERG